MALQIRKPPTFALVFQLREAFTGPIKKRDDHRPYQIDEGQIVAISLGNIEEPERTVEEPGIGLVKRHRDQYRERMDQIEVQDIEQKWDTAEYHDRFRHR